MDGMQFKYGSMGAGATGVGTNAVAWADVDGRQIKYGSSGAAATGVGTNAAAWADVDGVFMSRKDGLVANNDLKNVF